MKLKKISILWALALFPLLSGSVFAEKVIYVHGMNLISSNAACQDQTTCDYWKAPIVGDHVFVGYDGRKDPFGGSAHSGSVRLLAMLNKYCRKDQGQTCRLVVDSMGGYTAAGTISLYNSTGLYNILYSTQIVSAEGGSEIANLGDGAIDILKLVFSGIGGLINGLAESRDAIDALVTSNARGQFDHNRTNGTLLYHVAAKKSIFIAEPFLPGKDDSLVAFHSSCGYRSVAAFKQCMGQKVRSCSWCFWQRKKLVTPWDGHFMHPVASTTGQDTSHAETHNDSRYYGL